MDITFEAKTGSHVFCLYVGGKGPVEFFLDGERIRVEYLDMKDGQFGELPIFFSVARAGKHYPDPDMG